MFMLNGSPQLHDGILRRLSLSGTLMRHLGATTYSRCVAERLEKSHRHLESACTDSLVTVRVFVNDSLSAALSSEPAPPPLSVGPVSALHAVSSVTTIGRTTRDYGRSPCQRPGGAAHAQSGVVHTCNAQQHRILLNEARKSPTCRAYCYFPAYI